MGIFVFTALRTRQGVDTRAFEERFGESFFRVYKDRAELIKKYIDEGLMFLSGSRLALTEQGIDVSNDIMSEFV
jgi:oxygen-independent coproporphyrinogen-3 oxidase